jgi:hypothetical protein
MAEPTGCHAPSFLCSRRVSEVFRFAAYWMIAVALFLIIMVILSYDRTSPSVMAWLSLRVVGGILGIVGAFAALTIFVGMLAYLFTCDRSSSKLGWMIVFFLTAWFGSSLYFFLVYERQLAAGKHPKAG